MSFLVCFEARRYRKISGNATGIFKIAVALFRKIDKTTNIAQKECALALARECFAKESHSLTSAVR
jgi:hypothetical protein